LLLQGGAGGPVYPAESDETPASVASRRIDLDVMLVSVGNSALDSVFVAFQVDQDLGPVNRDRYFADDLAEPRVPQGPDLSLTDFDFDDPNNPNRPYLETMAFNDPRRQFGLCTRDTIFVHGYSVVDDDGDDNQRHVH